MPFGAFAFEVHGRVSVSILMMRAGSRCLLFGRRLPPTPHHTTHLPVAQVQGVWFRKFTVAKAQALHLVGWCANTQRGTVMGECQGNPQDLQVMKVCGEGGEALNARSAASREGPGT